MKRTPNQFEDIADDLGTPYCAWGTSMTFWGYDHKRKSLKYQCPQACGKDGCTWLYKCSKSSYGYVVKIRIKDYYRRFCPAPRHTNKWRKLKPENLRGADIFKTEERWRWQADQSQNQRP